MCEVRTDMNVEEVECEKVNRLGMNVNEVECVNVNESKVRYES